MKQHSTEQWIKEQVKWETKKFPETKKTVAKNMKFLDAANTVVRGKFIAVNIPLLTNKNKCKRNLNLHLKELQKENWAHSYHKKGNNKHYSRINKKEDRKQQKR